MQGIGWAQPGQYYSEGKAISRDGSTIVGYSFGRNTSDAFVWTEETGMQTLPILPGALDAIALGVNVDGHLVVGESGGRGALWRDGVLTSLGIVGNRITRAVATSDSGSVIVGNTDAFADAAVIWLDGGPPQLLSDYLATIGIAVPSGWVLRDCVAVSADGWTIAGYAQRGFEDVHQGFVIDIPCPSGLVLTGVFALRRSRRGR